MKKKVFSSYASKEMCRWWCSLESAKLITFFVALFIEESNTAKIFLFWVVAILTAISIYKTFPVFKKITNFVLVENDHYMRKHLLKIRNILVLLVFLDLIPFIPLVQAITRYRYYKLEATTLQIFEEIKIKYTQKFITY